MVLLLCLSNYGHLEKNGNCTVVSDGLPTQDRQVRLILAGNPSYLISMRAMVETGMPSQARKYPSMDATQRNKRSV